MHLEQKQLRVGHSVSAFLSLQPDPTLWTAASWSLLLVFHLSGRQPFGLHMAAVPEYIRRNILTEPLASLPGSRQQTPTRAAATPLVGVKIPDGGCLQCLLLGSWESRGKPGSGLGLVLQSCPAELKPSSIARGKLRLPSPSGNHAGYSITGGHCHA